jgi:hypothetical protein
MRVLQVGQFPPPHGGVQSILIAICQSLRARGIACAVINFTRFRRSDVDGVCYPQSAILRRPSDRGLRRTVEQILDGSDSASPPARNKMNDNSFLAVLSYIASWPFLSVSIFEPFHISTEALEPSLC